MANYSGTAGPDIIIGTPDADTVTNIGQGLDTVSTLGGDDTVYVTPSGGGLPNLLTTVAMGAGNDLLVIDGHALADGFTMSKPVLDVSLFGLSGGLVLGGAQRLLYTGVEHFQVTGGAGADHITLGSGDDVVDGGAGADVLDGGGGADLLTGGAGADNFTVSSLGDSTVAAADRITDFQSGADKLDISAADGGRLAISYSGDHADVYFGLNGADYAGRVQVYGDAIRPADIVTTATAVDLFGSSGADTLQGGAGADYLNGGAGADTLVGLGGADRMIGGAGADTFVYTAASDSTIAAPDQILDFQGGTDKLDVSAADQGQVAMAIVGDHTDVYFGKAADGSYTGVAHVYGDIRATDIVSTSGSISMFGSAGNDVLISGDKADFLSGGAGDDYLVGQVGADRLVGGAGSDTFFYGGLVDSPVSAPDQILDFQSGQDKINTFFSDGGKVAIKYVGGHSEVYFGTDAAGNFADMILVYGDLVQPADILGGGSSVFVFPT